MSFLSFLGRLFLALFGQSLDGEVADGQERRVKDVLAALFRLHLKKDEDGECFHVTEIYDEFKTWGHRMSVPEIVDLLSVAKDAGFVQLIGGGESPAYYVLSDNGRDHLGLPPRPTSSK